MPAPGTPYVSSRRARNAHSSALSHDFNPRNLEDGYYPSYDCTLTELFQDFLDLRVCSRPGLNLSSAELARRRLADSYSPDAEIPVPSAPSVLDDQPVMQPPPERQSVRIGNKQKAEAEEKHKSDQERAKLLEEAQKAAELSYFQLTQERQSAAAPKDASAADTSFGSEATVPDTDSLTIYPDFGACHTFGVRETRPTNLNRLYSWRLRQRWRIVHECYSLFLENKRQPTRHKPNNLVERRIWDQALADYLEEAADDMVFYLSIYFSINLSAQAVVAMVASGLHWKWVHFTRNEIPEINYAISLEMLRRRENDWKNEELHAEALLKFEKAKLYALGTKKSDQALAEMRDKTLQIVNEHIPYGPTMLRAKRKPKPEPKGKGKGKGKAKEVSEPVEESGNSEEEQYEQYRLAPGETEAVESWDEQDIEGSDDALDF
ncbi:hypothetical protein HGRIS_014625 [Hohenbuehelia grisea]|uniref:Uncharacterized protein n=1 Tax=Hohenbuehelia grisea TaxID=104357 RepID=A0ABR3JW96_9AGAR